MYYRPKRQVPKRTILYVIIAALGNGVYFLKRVPDPELLRCIRQEDSSMPLAWLGWIEGRFGLSTKPRQRHISLPKHCQVTLLNTKYHIKIPLAFELSVKLLKN